MYVNINIAHPTEGDEYVMDSHKTRLRPSIRSHQDCQVLSDFLGFEVLIGGGLEVNNIILEIIKTCLVYKRDESSINSLKTSLTEKNKLYNTAKFIFKNLPCS